MPLACGLSHPAVDVSAQLLTRFGLADVTVINSSAGAALHVDELLPGTTVRTSRIRDEIDDSALSRDVCFAATAMPGDVRAIAQRPDPHANVAAAVSVLAGHGSASARNAVALNAALLMVTGQAALTLQAGLDTAQAILRTDAALDTCGASSASLAAPRTRLRHFYRRPARGPLLRSRTRRTFHADPR